MHTLCQALALLLHGAAARAGFLFSIYWHCLLLFAAEFDQGSLQAALGLVVESSEEQPSD
jgi:hypothetical protein